MENIDFQIPEQQRTDVSGEVARYRGAPWYEEAIKTEIDVCGCGGIGSYVAFFVSRISPMRINLHDRDIVNDVNMSGQLFSRTDMHAYKVDAIREFLMNYSNIYTVNARRERINSSSILNGVVLCGFDNMQARKDAYNAWKANIHYMAEPRKCIFIDGRLAAENYQIFAIEGDNLSAMQEYEDKWLFSDDEADATICSYKQTSFAAGMIACNMVSILVNHLTNITSDVNIRDVPFMTEMDLPMGFYKTSEV